MTRLTDERLAAIGRDAEAGEFAPLSRSEVLALARDLLACRQMLRSIEWSAEDGGICPACGVGREHEDDCELDALIQEE